MNADELLASSGGLSTAAWPGRHRIGSFELQSVLLRGAAGWVYRAWDHALARPVAIKEYLPATLARRDANGEVRPAEPAAAAVFERGRHAFVDEARTLARCDHPSLVRVLDLVEAHGTAYRVMPWYSGRPLLDVRRKMVGPLSPPALHLLLDNLLGALEAYQRVGGVHRSVSPSQVLLLDDGRALLLGPGAASRALQIGSVDAPAEAHDAGFAPPEQASPSNGQAQGPWTDFYALAAVARFCIIGLLPPEAGPGSGEPLAATVVRLFSGHASLRYGADLLHALDTALSPDIAKRPQTAAQFREWLLHAQPPRPAPPTSAAASVDAASPVDTAGAVGASQPGRPQATTPQGPRRGPSWPLGAGAEGALGANKETGVVAADAADAIDAEMADLIQRVVDSVPAPLAPALGLDPHTPSLLHASPADGDDPRTVRRPPPPRRKHPALWTGLALAAVTAVAVLGFGAWALQAPPFRLTVAALLPSPSAAVPAPVTPAQAPMAAPVRLAAVAPEHTTPVEPTPPAATARVEPRPSTAPAQPDLRAANTAPAAPAVKRPTADSAADFSVTNPRQECGARTEFSLYRCMQQQCSLAKWQRHPQCQRLETTDSVD